MPAKAVVQATDASQAKSFAGKRAPTMISVTPTVCGVHTIRRYRLAGEGVRSQLISARRIRFASKPAQRGVFGADGVRAAGRVFARQQRLNTLPQERLLPSQIRWLDHALGVQPGFLPIRLVEAVELDRAAGGRCMDKSPFPDVDAGMADV